jgi:predicted DNA-binding transcriptional regulator AlpA
MQFLRISDVAKKTGRSQSQIYKEVKKGLFPAQATLGCKSIRGWEEDEIDRMMKLVLQGGSIEERRTESRQIEKDRMVT